MPLKTKAPSHLRYDLLNFLEGKPSAFKTAIVRGAIWFCLLLMVAPRSVRRDLVYGANETTRDLKTGFRSMVWLWNRSWIPFKHPMGTFFDIGWTLSEKSCHALQQRGFLSRDEFKRRCDLAQYTLSAIRAGLNAGNKDKLIRADREICELVDEVLQLADRWLTDHPTAVRPSVTTLNAPRTDSQAVSDGFHNERTCAALFDFNSLCADIGQEYFLVSGTFLGAVRDGAFIGHDHDIDLGVFEKHLSPDFLPALAASEKFTVTRVDHASRRSIGNQGVDYREMEKPLLVRIVHDTGIAIDVFIHFCDGEVAWHGTSAQRWDNQRFILADYPFLGRSFRGAADFDLYLTENYGPDWRVPKVAFDSNFDTPNISFMHTANGLVFYAWALAKSIADSRPNRVQRCLDILCSANAIERRNGFLVVRRSVGS